MSILSLLLPPVETSAVEEGILSVFALEKDDSFAESTVEFQMRAKESILKKEKERDLTRSFKNETAAIRVRHGAAK